MEALKEQKLNRYITFLKSKGFRFHEDFYGFVQFGKGYTNADDEIVIWAIELTLKSKKTFDGAFFIALLELFVKENIKSRQEAIAIVKKVRIL